MSTESREHLSCLMDGEISRETGRFLVRRLGADQELSATWTRYHLVRDCLRHQDGAFADGALSSRVRKAIENDPGAKPRVGRASAWLKPAAGLAVAASVALLAIVAVGPGQDTIQAPAASPAAAAVSESFTPPQALTPPPVSQQVSLAGQSADDSRMNAYLLRHLQATGSTGGKGFVTFVPIVIRTTTAQTLNADGADADPPESDPAKPAER